MNPFRNIVTARNLLIGAGAYYLAGWLNFFLSIGYQRLTDRIIYSGDFESAVVLPLMVHLPKAIVAAGAGAAVVWLCESERAVGWVIFPVLLYAVLGFFGFHWAQPPVLVDRVQQTVAAMFPAVACALGGMMDARRRTTPGPVLSTPD